MTAEHLYCWKRLWWTESHQNYLRDSKQHYNSHQSTKPQNLVLVSTLHLAYTPNEKADQCKGSDTGLAGVPDSANAWETGMGPKQTSA